MKPISYRKEVTKTVIVEEGMMEVALTKKELQFLELVVGIIPHERIRKYDGDYNMKFVDQFYKDLKESLRLIDEY